MHIQFFHIFTHNNTQAYSVLLLFVTIGEIIKTHFAFVHFFFYSYIYSFIIQFQTYIECIKHVCKIKNTYIIAARSQPPVIGWIS